MFTKISRMVIFGLVFLLSKIVMHEFWYQYVKPGEKKTKLRYMDTDKFNVHVKAFT